MNLPSDNMPVTKPDMNVPSDNMPVTKPDMNLPSDNMPVTKPDMNLPSDNMPGTKPDPQWSVSLSSLYPCSQPGYYREDSSCQQFYVCKEVAPGLLSADRIFSCPDRYLFDPVT